MQSQVSYNNSISGWTSLFVAALVMWIALVVFILIQPQTNGVASLLIQHHSINLQQFCWNSFNHRIVDLFRVSKAISSRNKNLLPRRTGRKRRNRIWLWLVLVELNFDGLNNKVRKKPKRAMMMIHRKRQCLIRFDSMRAKADSTIPQIVCDPDSMTKVITRFLEDQGTSIKQIRWFIHNNRTIQIHPATDRDNHIRRKFKSINNNNEPNNHNNNNNHSQILKELLRCNDKHRNCRWWSANTVKPNLTKVYQNAIQTHSNISSIINQSLNKQITAKVSEIVSNINNETKLELDDNNNNNNNFNNITFTTIAYGSRLLNDNYYLVNNLVQLETYPQDEFYEKGTQTQGKHREAIIETQRSLFSHNRRNSKRNHSINKINNRKQPKFVVHFRKKKKKAGKKKPHKKHGGGGGGGEGPKLGVIIGMCAIVSAFLIIACIIFCCLCKPAKPKSKEKKPPKHLIYATPNNVQHEDHGRRRRRTRYKDDPRVHHGHHK